MDLNAWAEHVLSIAAQRFERRLAEAIRQEMANQRAELLKWSLIFWIGQFAAFTAVRSFMLRAR